MSDAEVSALFVGDKTTWHSLKNYSGAMYVSANMEATIARMTGTDEANEYCLAEIRMAAEQRKTFKDGLLRGEEEL